MIRIFLVLVSNACSNNFDTTKTFGLVLKKIKTMFCVLLW